MSGPRKRISPMHPDNLPSGSRRRPPDDDTTPAPASTPAHSRDLTVVPEASESASKLASMLAGSDQPDSPPAGGADGGGEGPSVPLSALTAPPPVDPELDLVPSGLRVPRYVAQAVRTQAFLARRSQQDVVLDALLGRRPLSPELLDECRRAATDRR